MNAPATPDTLRSSLSEKRIDDDVFERMRRENLARWPTGSAVDFEAAVARHQNLPRHKQLGWVMREAEKQGRCLTQPRGGFGTFEMHRDLMVTLDREGLADVVPTTTDSYTRNEQFADTAELNASLPKTMTADEVAAAHRRWFAQHPSPLAGRLREVEL